jgi:hypothetical protein
MQEDESKGVAGGAKGEVVENKGASLQGGSRGDRGAFERLNVETSRRITRDTKTVSERRGEERSEKCKI